MSRQTSSLGPEILLDLDRASSQPLGAQLQDMFREAIRAGRRRQALVEWAREVDGFIVEGDYDAEFRYDRQPVGSLQGLAPDRVISIGTVS